MQHIENALEKITLKIRINNPSVIKIKDVPSLSDHFEIKVSEKLYSIVGELLCPVDMEKIELNEAILCPNCMTPYHVDCALLLAKRHEKCWKCEEFTQFDLLVRD